jgi:hypothetical protein
MLRISNFGNPERFAKEKRREVSRLYERFAKEKRREVSRLYIILPKTLTSYLLLLTSFLID